MNGLSTSEACANVRTTWQETRIGSDWLVGDDITARARDVCIISSKKLSLDVVWCYNMQCYLFKSFRNEFEGNIKGST